MFVRLDQNDSLKHCKVMELPGIFSASMCFQSHSHRNKKKNIKSLWKIVADTSCAKLLLAANQKVIPSMGLGQRQNLVTIKQMKKKLYSNVL